MNKYVFDTVFSLQAIPNQHGKCINDKTGKVNPPCICKSIALTDNYVFYFIFKMHWQILLKSVYVNYMMFRIAKLDFIVVYTLMKYCAVHLGLDEQPLHFKV